eukprot:scaffold274798_cov18-Tisochrysis_lutea.AAC.1
MGAWLKGTWVGRWGGEAEESWVRRTSMAHRCTWFMPWPYLPIRSCSSCGQDGKQGHRNVCEYVCEFRKDAIDWKVMAAQTGAQSRGPGVNGSGR